MTTVYQDFLSSPPFLVQGPNGRSFHVHSKLLAAHSNVLDMDVNSGMRESTDQTIRIMDIDGDIDDNTVTQFIEYAYTGHFTVPVPASLQDTQRGFADENPAAPMNTTGHALRPKAMRRPDEFAWVGPPLNRTHRDRITTPIDLAQIKLRIQKRRAALWAAFASHRATVITPPREPRKVALLTREHKRDLAAFLIAHARLYVFSLRYGCGGLATAALQRLRLVLSEHDPGDAVTAVVALLAYAYANTHEYGDGCDRLRRLVLDCLVCCLEEAESKAEFWGLLERDDQIAEDLDHRLVELYFTDRMVMPFPNQF